MNYISVRVSTLRGDQPIDFDLYISLNQKYIHYIKQGDSFEGERLDRLKKKKLKKMYIQQEHETNYQDYINNNLEKAYNSTSTPIAQRAEIAQGASQAAVEEAMENPENEAAYNAAKTNMNKYTKFLFDNDEALKAVMAIENSDKNIAHHGISVASLSVSLAKETGLSDVNQLNSLALGACFHDIGHSDCSYDLAQDPESYDEKTLQDYQDHTKRGVDRFKETKHVDEAVARIILEHEELADGSGYPNKLDEKKIDKLSLIVGICSAYNLKVSLQKQSSQEVAANLTSNLIGKYPLPLIQAFQKVLKNS